MKKCRLTLRLLLAASAMTSCLSACGGSGPSSSSAAVSTAKSASWTDVSLRSLDGTVNINWDKSAGPAFGSTAPTYNIYCSTNPNGIMQESNRIATNYSGQSFDHTSVTNGQRYYYVVTAVTAAGEGPASRPVSATPQAAQPAAPYGLKVTALDSSVKLEFLGPTPLNPANVSYNLYRSTTRNISANDKIKSNITFPYVDNDPKLSVGNTYYYAVTATPIIAGTESVFSPLVSARLQAIIPPLTSSPLAAFASPTNMSAEPGNGSCIIRWTDVGPLDFTSPDPATSTAPDYILYWSGTPDVSPALYDGRADDIAKDLQYDANKVFTYTLPNLANGKYYFQLVAAVKGSIPGRFTPGPVISVTLAPKIPAIPSGVAATQGSQQVSLSWNKDSSGITGVISYNVYFSTTDAASPAELMANGTKVSNTDPTKPYFTHTGLPSGKTYYYVVTSVGEAESAPSNVISVTL